MTESCQRYDPFIWMSHMKWPYFFTCARDMTELCQRYDPFIWMSHMNVWNDTLMSFSLSLIHMCVWYDWIMLVAWLVHMKVSHECLKWPSSLTCARHMTDTHIHTYTLNYVSGMTHSYGCLTWMCGMTHYVCLSRIHMCACYHWIMLVVWLILMNLSLEYLQRPYSFTYARGMTELCQWERWGAGVEYPFQEI